MNPKPTLQTMPFECLLEILRFVPLPECILLRSSCFHLKTAVDEHFRTCVRKLPVLLTASEKKPISQYLRCKNYLSVRDPNRKFNKFVDFIGKHLPKITQLELVIDDYRDLAYIFTILDIYSNQLKVLRLKSISYGGIDIKAMSTLSSWRKLPNMKELSAQQLYMKQELQQQLI